MSFEALRSSGSSLKNIQTGIDTVAHNIANVNTTGYKQKTVNFESVVSNYGESKLSGTAVNSITSNWGQGRIKVTSNFTDLMLQGQGFFSLQDPSGNLVYTRAGHFLMDRDGALVNPEGHFVMSVGGGKILMPLEATQVEINTAGEVRALLPGALEFTPVDQIQIANFANPQGLHNVGDNNFAPTENSGEAEFSTALGQGTSTATTELLSGALESSNADLSGSLTEMIAYQRSYQAVARSATTANDVLETTINLTR
ncbi:MAG: flagellar hook basal-body protein [Candidatus Caenarcaniphilales bacterium]|jgi:flagellar basal-body rod protein FlgG|nr:flagellar hook basal-body protein [Candidatus Caenarcaniphilales bacterium]